MASQVRARAPRPRNRQLEALTAEATSGSCTDALTPEILRRPPSPGSLDPLANCTKLETLNLTYCEALTGTSSLVGPENDCSCI